MSKVWLVTRRHYTPYAVDRVCLTEQAALALADRLNTRFHWLPPAGRFRVVTVDAQGEDVEGK